MGLHPRESMPIWASSVVRLLGQHYSRPLKFAAPFVLVCRGERTYLSYPQPSELEGFVHPFRPEEVGMKWNVPGKA